MGNAAPEAPRDPGAVPVSVESQMQHPTDMAASWSHLHGMILHLLADDAALERECDRMMPRRGQPVDQPPPRQRAKSGSEGEGSDGSEGDGNSDEEGRMKPSVAARRQGAASDPKPLAGNRISPEELQRVTQCLIDRLGCRHPKTLERVGAVYATFAGREDGLTNHEFRGYVACILTQALRELEGRCAAAGVRVMSVAEARSAMGAPQLEPEPVQESGRAAEQEEATGGPGTPPVPPGVAFAGQRPVAGGQRSTTDVHAQYVHAGGYPPGVPSNHRMPPPDPRTTHAGAHAVAGDGRPLGAGGNVATLHRQELPQSGRQQPVRADAPDHYAVRAASQKGNAGSAVARDRLDESQAEKPTAREPEPVQAPPAREPEPAPVLSELQRMMQDMDALTSSLVKGDVLPPRDLAEDSIAQSVEPVPGVVQGGQNGDSELAALELKLAELNSSRADTLHASELPRTEPPLFAPASCTEPSLDSITSDLDALTASLKGEQLAPKALPEALGPRSQSQAEARPHSGRKTADDAAQHSEPSSQRSASRGKGQGSGRVETAAGSEFLSVAPVLESYPDGQMCLMPLNGPPPSPPASPRQSRTANAPRQGQAQAASAGRAPRSEGPGIGGAPLLQPGGACGETIPERPPRPENLTAKDLGMTAYGTPSGEPPPPLEPDPRASGDGTVAAETAGKKLMSGLKGAGGIVASGWTAFADGMEKIFVPEIVEGDADWHAAERMDGRPGGRPMIRSDLLDQPPAQAPPQAGASPPGPGYGPGPGPGQAVDGGGRRGQSPPMSAPRPAAAPYQGARDMGRADLHEFGRGKVPAPPPGSEPTMLLTMRDEPPEQEFAHQGMPPAGGDYQEMGHPGMAHPGMSQPSMSPPGMSHPGMSHPMMPQGGMPHAGMGHPGMAHPGMAHPGMPHPGMPHPGMPHPGMGPPAQEVLMGQRGVADVPMLFRVPSPEEIHDLLQVEGLPAYVGGGQGFAPKRLCLDGHGETLYVLESDSSVPSIFFGMPGFPLRDLRRIVHGSASQPGAPPLLSLEFEEGYLPVRLGDAVVMHGLLASLIQGRNDVEVVRN